jgi:hypothetical protein
MTADTKTIGVEMVQVPAGAYIVSEEGMKAILHALGEAAETLDYIKALKKALRRESLLADSLYEQLYNKPRRGGAGTRTFFGTGGGLAEA